MIRGEPGERLGRYRIVRRLATGATTDVLLAVAEGPLGFERSVVLKVLLTRFEDDAEPARMFAREAGAYARLSHPSIVHLYDFFAREGQLVMALEYVHGPSLARFLGMMHGEGHVLDDRAAIHVSACLFAALAAAHAAFDEAGRPSPVIHRDVNPSNVLLPWNGEVKLADFGFAKITGAEEQSRAGLIKGTYGYMAPEQVVSGKVSPRTDVYACAIVLWELLARRRAFRRGALPEAEALRVLAEPRITPITSIRSDVPHAVASLLARALQPSEAARAVSAAEAVAVLRALVSPDDGRETLARALALVRHEPAEAPSDAPFSTALPPPVVPPLRTTGTTAESHTMQFAAASATDLGGVLDEVLRGAPGSPRPAMFEGTAPMAPPLPMPPRGLGEIPAPPGALEPLLYAASEPKLPVASVSSPSRTLAMNLGALQDPAGPSVHDVDTAVPPPIGSLPAEPPGRPRGAAGSIVATFAVAGLVAVAGMFAYARAPSLRAGVSAVLARAHSGDGARAATEKASPRPPVETAPVEAPPVEAPPVEAAPVETAPVETAPIVAASVEAVQPPVADAGHTAPLHAGDPSPPRPRPAMAAGMGMIVTAGATAGRRIFVDGRTVGQTPETIPVKCGTHSVKLGTSGREKSVEVPCGGEVTMSELRAP